jgi:hypothetical protein
VVSQILDMTAAEVGQLVHHQRYGKTVLGLAKKLPRLHMEVTLARANARSMRGLFDASKTAAEEESQAPLGSERICERRCECNARRKAGLASA